jgi:ureidoacrylate peracid hydrolase
VTEAITIPARYYRLSPPDARGHVEETLTLPLDETVFLLVDVYGAEAEAEGVDTSRLPGNRGRRILQERIVPAKAAAVRAGLQVVYVTNRLRSGLSEGNEWRTMSVRTHHVDVLETWRWPNAHLSFPRAIAPAAHEPVVEKQVFSGFFETNLDGVLRGYGARNLFVVGGDGMICLGTTVTDAMYRDYRVIALRDAVITNEYPETSAEMWASFLAIRQIESTVGYTCTTEDFIAACDDVAARKETTR